MKPQHQNNTFIDRKQCSLVSSRGKPLGEEIFITKNFKTKLPMPSTLIYTKSIYQNNNLEEYLLKEEASVRSSYI